MLLIYSALYFFFALELREQLEELQEQIEQLQEEFKKVKADLTKAKAENGNIKRNRQEEGEAFAEFLLFQEFKRQRQEQQAPVHLQQAHVHPSLAPMQLQQAPIHPALAPVQQRRTWIPSVDSVSGRECFFNTFTGESRWEIPFY